LSQLSISSAAKGEAVTNMLLDRCGDRDIMFSVFIRVESNTCWYTPDVQVIDARLTCPSRLHRKIRTAGTKASGAADRARQAQLE
jgi:hypothetical protein